MSTTSCSSPTRSTRTSRSTKKRDKLLTLNFKALQEEADRLTSERRTDPRASERARHIRQLTEVLSGLEEDLQDRQRAEQAQKLREAAARSRQVASGALRKLQEVDGTDDAARASTVERIYELL